MNRHITIPKNEIDAFCRQNHIRSLGLFGSAVREDFGPGSDVDVLIEFEQVYRPGLMELVDMQEELTRIFGQKVDLVERQAVERSENYIRRRHILESVEPIYVAR
ncbi:MAG: nucleotidyltransferase domain-containing protein [Phycisphaerae bacterium]|nr:nucleotidyltransferase domain-containing protein [Phycisphaerae bacterium]